MQIQINTDHNIEGHQAMETHVRDVVASTLDHVRSHITRVEVYLGDEIGQRTKNLSVNNVDSQLHLAKRDDGCGYVVECDKAALKLLISHQ